MEDEFDDDNTSTTEGSRKRFSGPPAPKDACPEDEKDDFRERQRRVAIYAAQAAHGRPIQFLEHKEVRRANG